MRRWPLFGWFAAIAGTVFVDRERRTHVGEVNREIEAALAAGALVVVFPEGTSSDGATVLPFRTSLLEPAARGGHEIAVGWLHYDLEDGDAATEVCYWGDHSFVAHLLNLLGKNASAPPSVSPLFSAPRMTGRNWPGNCGLPPCWN